MTGNRKRTRFSTDEVPSIDSRILQRTGAFVELPDEGRWLSPLGEPVLPTVRRLQLHVPCTGDPMPPYVGVVIPIPGSTKHRMEVVLLEGTACTFGGERLWFRCPECGSRRAVVY